MKTLLPYALFHWLFRKKKSSRFFIFFLAFLREKRKKNARKLPNARKTQEHFSILHYALGKNASLLRFSRVFSRVFARVFAHKPYQNATPTHSVIWAKTF